MQRLSLEYDFESPLPRVWRALSDTERFNRAAGLPPVAYQDQPQPDGTTRRFCKTSKLGMELDYEELPFTWVHEKSFSVERIYANGPLKWLKETLTLWPKGQGTHVETVWEWEARGAFDGLVAGASIKQMGLKPFRRVFGELDQRLRAPEAELHSGALRSTVYGDSESASDEERRRIDAFLPRVREVYDSPLLSLLRAALVERADSELRRMQPLAYAREWGAARLETVNTFLGATRAGLLRMRWDVICPHCRGDKENLRTLCDAKESAFCSACNLSFDVDLDRSLEPVFTPHPQVREVEEARYCLGGPGVTPHVVYQRLFAPGAEDHPELSLPPGRYRVRVSGEASYRWIDIEPEAAAERATLHIGEHALLGGDARLASGRPVVLSLKNESSRRALLVLESVLWAKDALSAGELIADQRFRDLFSGEILAPGVKLAVESATILFTDLVGSTAMYERLGDASAFRLVWTHFDALKDIVARHQGAIVKTIGDAIMAVFMRPEEALLAAAELHARVGAYCKERGHQHPVSLKVGVHQGPCIAVTLNERLDYFGSTVNLAARVESQSQGEDIVLSAALAEMGAVLRERGWRSEPLEARVKGFAAPVPMLRFRRAQGTE